MNSNEAIPNVEVWDLGTNDLLIARIFYELEDQNRDAFVDLMQKFFSEAGKRAAEGTTRPRSKRPPRGKRQ